ncbi:MAG: CRP-like cAMP-binding protein [Myxococcota bacterium]|jgi:CRP-like cAMP-binding protein
MFAALPPVFAGLSRSDADEAASYLRQVDVEPGDVLTYEGETDLTIAFIAAGTVELWRGEIKVGSAGPRDMFGEVELFTGGPRVGSVTALGPVTLHALDADGYVALCDAGNPVVFALERAVHRRLCDRIRLLHVGIVERSPGVPFRLSPPTTHKSFFARLMDRVRGPEEPPQPTAVPADALQRSMLFDWAEPEVVQALAGFFRPVRFGPEEVLLRQGGTGDRILLLVEGKVETVLRVDELHAESLAVVEPGIAFGDVAVALGSPRTATFVSRGPVQALEIERASFLSLYQIDDALGSTFRQGLIRNLILQLDHAVERYALLEHRRLDMLAQRPVDEQKHLWRD